MIRLLAKRTSKITVVPGSDKVLFGISLPAGSRLNGLTADIHVWEVDALAQRNVFMYALEGWILPVHDPDSGSTMDTLFDQLVPKDTDVEVLDSDTGASDTSPFFEPGEPDVTQLFDIGLRPERVFHRNEMLSYAKGPLVRWQETETPFARLWCAGDTFQVRIKKNYRVQNPSILVFAFASPSLDDTSSTIPAVLAENEWPRVQYIGEYMQQAMMHMLGLTEAGAETPWVEMSALVLKHLEPDVFETVGGDFATATWHVAANAKIDHSVEGRMADSILSTGR